MRKQHLSVLMLMARSSIYKILVLLALMAAVEGGLFCYTLSRGFDELRCGLELLIQQSRIAWVFGVAFVVLTDLLTRMGWQGGSRQEYTLMRLAVSERWVFFWQSVYHFICYLLFWAVQVLTVMVFCRIYTIHAPQEYVTGQTVFLAFYRSRFLHWLMPMEDVMLWAANVIAAASLSICSACYPVAKRRGQRGGETVAITAAMILYGCDAGEIGDAVYFLFVTGIALVTAGIAIFRILGKEDEDETEEA